MLQHRSALVFLLVLASLFACSARGTPRTAHLFGITIHTAIEPSLAVIAEPVASDGAAYQSCYALLGPVGGEQSVGAAMPPVTKVALRFGTDADVIHIGDDNKEEVVAEKSLRGLAGANVGNGRLELRGATSTLTMTVEVATPVEIELRDGKLAVVGR